jgi:F0F1-type ATP synthase membrane subunit c/vacuolar-type H+-ATPase subunit K
MALPLGTALLYGFVPALAGSAVGFLLLRPARQAAAEIPAAPVATAPGQPPVPNPKAFLPLLHALLATGPLFGFVAAFLASQPPAEGAAPADVPDATPWLLAVGLAGAATCILQGWFGGQGFPAVAKDPARFGRLLLRMVLPEVLVIAAVAAFMLRVQF